ncbi:hypothetical protein [Paracoccus sp. (in: a-proteobacteria)]|uniref:hypothetical protein n=1 Tax=Paracoccus sp. TaxID=267 RepID=UPI0026DEDDDE|nr:hypothetical protein [Paracoccus sp. (in: a-proteobacteria)]MDO5648347.1 hypothetical protein [Paracoccus sp. (in: a-proteobacteria)]
MTTQEQSLADDKMRAEIAKLIAETAKISKETVWHPLAVGARAATALIGAGAGLAAVLIKIFAA